jgi:hypothetical protein
LRMNVSSPTSARPAACGRPITFPKIMGDQVCLEVLS